MKKVLAFFVCVFFVALTANAQYTFAKPEKVVDHKQYAVVIADNGMELNLNPFLHRRLLRNPNDYLLLDVVAARGAARTLIHKDNISEWICMVDTVSYVPSYDMAAVRFTDGLTLLTTELEFLQVLKGQHVNRKAYLGETKVIIQAHTISRKEPLREGNKTPHLEARDDTKQHRLVAALILPGEPLPPLLEPDEE